MTHRFFHAGTVCALILFLSVASHGQEEAAKPAAPPVGEQLSLEQADLERPVMKNVTVDKKITGRLPNGYKAVITNAQRDEIYKVQKEYAEVIERLKARIERLETERDHQVDALLTEEQTEKLKTSGGLESHKRQLKKEKPVTRRSSKKAAEKSPGETASE